MNEKMITKESNKNQTPFAWKQSWKTIEGTCHLESGLSLRCPSAVWALETHSKASSDFNRMPCMIMATERCMRSPIHCFTFNNDHVIDSPEWLTYVAGGKNWKMNWAQDSITTRFTHVSGELLTQRRTAFCQANRTSLRLIVHIALRNFPQSAKQPSPCIVRKCRCPPSQSYSSSSQQSLMWFSDRMRMSALMPTHASHQKACEPWDKWRALGGYPDVDLRRQHEPPAASSMVSCFQLNHRHLKKIRQSHGALPAPLLERFYRCVGGPAQSDPQWYRPTSISLQQQLARRCRESRPTLNDLEDQCDDPSACLRWGSVNFPLFADHDSSVDFKLWEETLEVTSLEKPLSSRISRSHNNVASVEVIGSVVNWWVLSDQEVIDAHVWGRPTLWIFLAASHGVDQGWPSTNPAPRHNYGRNNCLASSVKAVLWCSVAVSTIVIIRPRWNSMISVNLIVPAHLAQA